MHPAVEQEIIRETKFQKVSEVHPDDSLWKDLEIFDSEVITHMKRMKPILDKVNELLEGQRNATSSTDLDQCSTYGHCHC